MLAYRFVTGDDDAAFCHRVTEALSKGWQLYGNPTYTQGPGGMRCGQALVKEVDGPYDPETRLASL